MRYTWESQKQKLQHYKRRQPETSVLYQIVYHSRDDLESQWESRFQHQYGVLRDEVTKTLDEYLNCGIVAHGAARVYCDGCNAPSLLPSPVSVEESVPPVGDPAVAVGGGGWR